MTLPGTMEEDWTQVPTDIRFSITTLDELGLPLTRRGVRTRIPRSDEVEAFIQEATQMVERTLRLIFSADSESATN